MKFSIIKQLQISPQDFSDRKHFPGTPGNPYHIIDKIQARLAPVPFPIFSLFFGGVVYLFSGELAKPLLIAGFLLLDWLLLCFLPQFQISFGPPALPALALGMMRSPFLIFNFPIALAFQILGTILVLYGFYFEPQFPRVTHHRVKFFKAKRETQPLRIVHLSDLHMEFFTSREERAIEQINKLEPDLILFSGDFFNISYQNHPESHHDIHKFFRALKSKHGIYAVTGSPSVDLKESLEKVLPDLNLILLRDQIVDLEIKGQPIQLIGLDCTHQPQRDVKRLKVLAHDLNLNAHRTRILLYHSPDIAPHLGTLPIDLQVSGHTHGGQVQIPLLGPIYTGSLYGVAFSSGHYFINDSLNLIVSRGLGLEGEAAPRVRFFSPPEICDITLEFTRHHVQLNRTRYFRRLRKK